MTAHPIDTEALRDADFLHPALLRTATLHLGPTATQGEAFAAGALYGRERFEDRERLAAAEHRATRAEAQSEARRINAEYWKDLARGRWARIKAVRDVHRKWTVGDPCDKRRGCGGADCAPHVNGYGDKVWRHWRDDCTGCAATWPCPTIRALDGSVPPPAA